MKRKHGVGALTEIKARLPNGDLVFRLHAGKGRVAESINAVNSDGIEFTDEMLIGERFFMVNRWLPVR